MELSAWWKDCSCHGTPDLPLLSMDAEKTNVRHVSMCQDIEGPDRGETSAASLEPHSVFL